MASIVKTHHTLKSLVAIAQVCMILTLMQGCIDSEPQLGDRIPNSIAEVPSHAGMLAASAQTWQAYETLVLEGNAW